ncbi:MAG: class IV adenylate cyclase [Saprospiraceae bacterium]|nr:class IV adenylate cyclase [Saprospiraceae bacterium]MCB9324151.1 class IV adenylate cyclase [Lewinellaceae bacterium]
MPTLIEIKARCRNPRVIKTILETRGADFKGIDHQIDTYFVVPNGRLKLRQGNIENTLIHYHRDNQAGPKKSAVNLYHPQDGASLKITLESALDKLVVVDKQRHIYFIDNVKFHVDEVKGLGTFVEIEAIDHADLKMEATLLKQCQDYMELLKIDEADLIEVSYSDMLLGLKK